MATGRINQVSTNHIHSLTSSLSLSIPSFLHLPSSSIKLNNLDCLVLLDVVVDVGKRVVVREGGGGGGVGVVVFGWGMIQVNESHSFSSSPAEEEEPV
jgi:hypothetical protein